MPFWLVEIGSLDKSNFPVRKGILLLRPAHRAINVGGSRISMLTGHATDTNTLLRPRPGVGD
jgi:hypothetical protein